MKPLGRLAPGEAFSAVIADIRPETVSLRLDSGAMLTARALVPPDARIGDTRRFAVRENTGGRLVVEMVKEGPGEKRSAFDIRV